MSDLDNAIQELCDAIHDKGSHPRFHDHQIYLLKTNWPTLWAAIQHILVAHALR